MMTDVEIPMQDTETEEEEVEKVDQHSHMDTPPSTTKDEEA